jgi:hypothetical protein
MVSNTNAVTEVSGIQTSFPLALTPEILPHQRRWRVPESAGGPYLQHPPQKRVPHISILRCGIPPQGIGTKQNARDRMGLWRPYSNMWQFFDCRKSMLFG